MRLKNFLFLLFLLTIAGRASSQVSFSVDPVSINAGETQDVDIQVSIAGTYYACQFDLLLPEGVSIAKDDEDYYEAYFVKAKNSEDHGLAVSNPTGNLYRFVISSNNNRSFIAKDYRVFVSLTLAADANASAGTKVAKIQDALFSISNTEGFEPDDLEFNIVLPTATVTMNNIGGAYWSTYYISTDNMEAPEGTQVFTASLSNAELTLTEVSNRIIKAGNGVILKSTASPITLTITESSATESYYANNCLVGTMTTITNPGNAYVLNYKENIGVAFYKLRAQGTIGANKAYLIYSSTNARESFSFSNISNGIESITSDMKSSHQVFDLQGRRVIQPKSGVYIMDGKKVVIK